MNSISNGRWFYLRLVGFLFFIYTILQIYCINQLSVNYDEGSFATYGTTILKFQKEKDIVQYESKLPITALNMLPRAAEQLIHPKLTRTWPESQRDIVNGRYVSLLFAILLGLVIFSWSRNLYNEKTAFFVVLLYLLCPNFLAHGVFVSSDIFACFFMTSALYCCWLFFKHREFKYFLFLCVSTALAQISKFSMFHLFLLIPFLFAAVLIYQRKEVNNAFRLKKIISYLALFLFINWAVICMAHLFYQVFVPINHYTFKSGGFKSLQQFCNNIFPGLLVPLPSAYVMSMDAVMYFDHLGGGIQGSLNGAPYILGKYSANGFWYYYFVAIFFKVPVSTLVLWLASILLFSFKFSRNIFLRNDIFLVVPIFYFIIYMNFFYSTQVGIRHLLIIFPLLFIFSGKIISYLSTGQKQLVLYSLLVYQAISVFSYFPHFLPYTNEFIINKKLAYTKIADTNICYGEGAKYLQQYLAKNPGTIYSPEKPTPGKIILEVNEMLNLNMATIHKFDWAKSLRPVDHIHSQYLVFDIDKQTADSLLKRYK